MSTMTDLATETSILLRARNLVEQHLTAAHVGALLQLGAHAPEPVELSGTIADELRRMGCAIPDGRSRGIGVERIQSCKLDDIGYVVVDMLLLQGRQVPGIGFCHCVGSVLSASGGLVLAQRGDDGRWATRSNMSEAESVVLKSFFPDLRWA